jgi:glutathione peroxidase
MNNSEITKSIYDIELKSVAGDNNFLDLFKGKVTLFANVTGHCGNAPQFGILQSIYDKYKDKGFEIVAVPTNDYCGPGVTYGQYECGIANAEQAKEYAEKEWGVTYPFAELVVSREDRDGENDGRVVHEIYKTLNTGGESSPINGNFEKFLVDKNGKSVLRLANGVLLNYAHEDGWCREPSVEYQKLCNAIEQLLDTPEGEEAVIGPDYWD